MPKIKTKERGTEHWAIEARTFQRRRAHLIQRYEGEFVALYRGRVVGHDADDEELARLMYERLGNVPFYIARVERQPTIYDLPSPEVGE
jgi:hypothetical protein